MYASCATIPAKMNYCSLEGEDLSILIGCKRFHELLRRHQFEVENDHKLLLSIFKSHIPKHYHATIDYVGSAAVWIHSITSQENMQQSLTHYHVYT